ncbi:BhlA/UviB family holin-like peptide [Alkaliphilus crotonatoxidans]
MEGELLKLAASQGIWAALSVVLIFYTFKTHEKRESKYQEIISGLTERLSTLDHMKQEIERIKERLKAPF